MLFTPVPSTAIYEQYLPYLQARGWERGLHMLNGKLYPFLEMNEGSVEDYVDLQRLMYMLNTQYRSRSFQLLGDTLVAESLRDNMQNGFGEFVRQYAGREVVSIGRTDGHTAGDSRKVVCSARTLERPVERRHIR